MAVFKGTRKIKILIGKAGLVLRAGYKTGQDIGPGWTAGLGHKMGKFGLDYAYVPYGDLGITHRVSVEVSF